MIFITDANELQTNNKIVCIYLYVPTIFYHKKICQKLQETENNTKNIIFYAVDIQSFPNLGLHFRVKCVPEIILLDNNEIKKRNNISFLCNLEKFFADIVHISVLN